MRAGTFAFLAGILTVLLFRELPPSSLLCAFPGVLICLLYRSPWLRVPACLLCGLFWALLRAEIILSHGLDREIEGKTLKVTGQVQSLPVERDEKVQFDFRIEAITDAAGRAWTSPGRVRLNWHRPNMRLIPGERWQLAVRLKRPYGFMNPGGFDYERWLFQHRIRATGYVVASAGNAPLGRVTGQPVNRIRHGLREAIGDRLEDHPYRGLVTALSIGDRSQVPPLQKDTLVVTGTNHLLAISGLHIGLIAGLVFFLARRLWPVCGTLALRLSAPAFAALAAMQAALIYAALAGFSIPTQRALIMLATIMWSVFSYRRYACTDVILLALLLVLIADPFAVMAAGFWLSFGAIAVIAYGMSCRPGAAGALRRWGRVQVYVAAGLMPLMLLWFQQVPVLGIPANLVAVPWVSLVVVPLALAGTLLTGAWSFLASLCLEAAADALALLWPFLSWLAQQEIALWKGPVPPVAGLLAGVAGVLILLQPFGLPGRWLGLIGLLPLITPRVPQPAEEELWFTLLDVGQGLSAVVRTRHHTLVYDTGARFSEHFNAGDAVLVPYLRNAGVDRVDVLVISHGDNDHAGGTAPLLSAYAVDTALTSVPDKLDFPRAVTCRDGQSWTWDGAVFRVLHPDDPAGYSSNNRSCVLKVDLAGHSILLSGDIEKDAEYRLVRKFRSRLTSSLLVAPHHGSKSSSSAEFITAVNPVTVLFPAGYRNRFNFPNRDIIGRYASRGIGIYTTARDGAISVKVTSSGMTFATHRRTGKRFWHTEF